MASFNERIKKILISCWSIFRLIFVIFFLYLLGDAFYRWDAFRHYASFKEFLPTVGLVSIFWVVLAASISLVVQIASAVISLTCRISRTKHGMNRTGQFLDIMQERITPLVWLFGLWVIISVPIVAYQTWGKETDRKISQNVDIPASNEKRPNILYVTFDALRVRSMSVYGYHRPTTPFISEWAKSASVFTRHQAASINTFQTTPCMMTGKRVWSHQIYHEHGVNQYRNKEENLPAVMKKNGYSTILIAANQIADAKKLGIDNSIDIEVPFNELIDTRLWLGMNYGRINAALYKFFNNKIRMYDWIVQQDFLLGKILLAFGLYSDIDRHPFPPEIAFNKFIKILEKKPAKPFFAWIHLNPPHAPYLAPPPYMGMFEPSEEYRTFKPQFAAIKSRKRESFSILRGRYDELIRYSDKKFEEFIKELERRGLLKDTIILLSADHGETFERDRATHGTPYLNEESTNIPLIIKEPGKKDGRFIHDLVEQIDIPATILGLSNIAVPEWMEGRSLVPLIQGEPFPAIPVLSMNLQTNPALGQEITKGSIAIWEGDYKLVHLLDKGESVLHNLKSDPDELDNLFEKEPEVGQHLLTILQDNLQQANERIIGGK